MQISPWAAPPSMLETEPDRVHLFRLRLDLAGMRLSALRSYLNLDEQARADRYRSPRDQRRFTAARGQLRKVLAGYTKTAPDSVRFDVNPHGKPFLAGPNCPSFNLSDSGEIALLAVGPAGMGLGVDVEAVRANLEFENMARRFFAPAEVAALLALPNEQRVDAFFACWTRKEAYIKARGLGLAIPLDGFEVSLQPGEPPRLVRPSADDPHGAAWMMVQIDPGPGYAGALCARGEIVGVRCWEWR